MGAVEGGAAGVGVDVEGGAALDALQRQRAKLSALQDNQQCCLLRSLPCICDLAIIKLLQRLADAIRMPV